MDVTPTGPADPSGGPGAAPRAAPGIAPGAAPGSAPAGPGERVAPHARLERPPSERYHGPDGGQPRDGPKGARGSQLAAVWGGLAAGAAGAAIFAGLAGPLSLDVGLLIVAAFIGWEVAGGVRIGGRAAVDRRTRLWLALGSTVVALTAGEVGTWLWARSEGGALPLLDHLWTVYGPLLPLQYVVALAVAAWSAR